MTAKKIYNFAKEALTAAGRKCKNIIVKSQRNILFNRNLPGAWAELRSGDARRACCEPHTSALAPGCFYALSIEGTV
jgi:hypothetical protein